MNFTNGVVRSYSKDPRYTLANLKFDPTRRPSEKNPREYNMSCLYKDKYYVYPKGAAGILDGQADYANRFFISAEFSKGELSEDQKYVINECSKVNSGLIIAPTGRGKSRAIAGLIRQRKTRTLVVVPKVEIAKGILDKMEYIYGEGKAALFRPGKLNNEDIIVCVGNSFNKHWDKLSGNFGMLIIDEAHMNLTGTERRKALCMFKCGYFFGLTGTPESKEMNNSVFDLIYGKRIEAKTEVNDCQVYTHLHYEFNFDTTKERYEILEDLHSRKGRKEEMAKVVHNVMKGRHMGIVFCDRVEMANDLSDRLNKLGTYAIPYTSQTKDRERVLKEVEVRHGVIVATWSCVGVGFDYPPLDTGFYFSPLKFSATTKQMVGRIIRKHPGKEKPILIDRQDSFLKSQYTQRLSIYKETYSSPVLPLNYKLWDLNSLPETSPETKGFTIYPSR